MNSAKPKPAAGLILGFDYGSKRIGVAVGQLISGTASSLVVVKNNPPELWLAIEDLLTEWKPVLLIVGLPLDLDGEETDTSKAARKFAGRLHGRFGLPVELQDERFTSMDASEQFKSLRQQGGVTRKAAKTLDAAAARLITEHWLQHSHLT